MKIGILTQPLHNNYGGLLQAYALQEILKREGHDAVTINRDFPPANKLRFILSITKGFFLYLLGKRNKIRSFPTKKELRCISKNTSKFIEDNILTTSKYCNTNQLKELKFDAYIVGSDQVWRPMYSPCISNYFFDFLNKDNNAKRIAYAASFGVDVNEYTSEEIEVCSPLSKQFNAISVREKSGIKLCKDIFEIEAQQTLDPTLLLEKKDYEDLVKKSNEKESEGNLFVYILDKNKEKTEIVSFVKEELDLKDFYIMPQESWPSENLDNCVFPSVTKWLRAFMDAEFIITDSFHGSVFSILFNKPFIAIANESRGRSRFDSLFKSLGLEDRLIDTKTKKNVIAVLLHNFDYQKVNRKLSILKKESYLFLNKHLC